MPNALRLLISLILLTEFESATFGLYELLTFYWIKENHDNPVDILLSSKKIHKLLRTKLHKMMVGRLNIYLCQRNMNLIQIRSYVMESKLHGVTPVNSTPSYILLHKKQINLNTFSSSSFFSW